MRDVAGKSMLVKRIRAVESDEQAYKVDDKNDKFVNDNGSNANDLISNENNINNSKEVIILIKLKEK